MFEDFSELTKGSYYFIVFVLLFGNHLAMCDSAIQIQRMVSSFDFLIKWKKIKLFSSQVQFEINGEVRGSKASAINMEAKPFNEIRVRSCVMTK